MIIVTIIVIIVIVHLSTSLGRRVSHVLNNAILTRKIILHVFAERDDSDE